MVTLIYNLKEIRFHNLSTLIKIERHIFIFEEKEFLTIR